MGLLKISRKSRTICVTTFWLQFVAQSRQKSHWSQIFSAWTTERCTIFFLSYRSATGKILFSLWSSSGKGPILQVGRRIISYTLAMMNCIAALPGNPNQNQPQYRKNTTMGGYLGGARSEKESKFWQEAHLDGCYQRRTEASTAERSLWNNRGRESCREEIDRGTGTPRHSIRVILHYPLCCHSSNYIACHNWGSNAGIS